MQLAETNMSENVPFIWRKNYRNELALPEKVLEHAHEKARRYLRRAFEIKVRSKKAPKWSARSIER